MYDIDIIADLIISAWHTTTLMPAQNGNNNTPYLKYIAARYGSYPNVWICLANEWDRNSTYPSSNIKDWGATMKDLLPYPTPLSVHGYAGDWKTGLNSNPSWNTHVIIQRKRRDLSDGADHNIDNFSTGGSNKPVINDELSYQGAGDDHSEGDTIESLFGAFLGGGYASTGYKEPNKSSQYMWGNFDASQHSAADNLLWVRQKIDEKISFWKMKPVSLTHSIFSGADSGFRAMEWPKNEYLLGTDSGQTFTVERFDVISKTQSVITTNARGSYTFSAPSSRAALFLFKRNGMDSSPPSIPKNLQVKPGNS
jgi:hypothetical protein